MTLWFNCDLLYGAVWCVLLLFDDWVVCVRVLVCLFVIYCVMLYGVLFVRFFCVLFFCVWCGCVRVCGGVWLVAVDCVCACGLKINNCVCVFCVGFKM